MAKFMKMLNNLFTEPDLPNKFKTYLAPSIFLERQDLAGLSVSLMFNMETTTQLFFFFEEIA